MPETPASWNWYLLFCWWAIYTSTDCCHKGNLASKFAALIVIKSSLHNTIMKGNNYWWYDKSQPFVLWQLATIDAVAGVSPYGHATGTPCHPSLSLGAKWGNCVRVGGEWWRINELRLCKDNRGDQDVLLRLLALKCFILWVPAEESLERM